MTDERAALSNLLAAAEAVLAKHRDVLFAPELRSLRTAADAARAALIQSNDKEE